jgi:HlyD family secretion protein
VHQLSVHTVGGVISPGDPIMLIVPGADPLLVEARIAPQEIDQVWVGQQVLLRFPAFNLRTTPELNGEVVRVSADVSQDAKSGVAFYTVRVTLPDHEIARLRGLTFVPGMPVEAFVQTGVRTALSYLVKPISDQMRKAWRER